MNLLLRYLTLSLALTLLRPALQAQTQSSAPADQEVAHRIVTALAAASVDSRITSVKVITTSDHVVYLTGLSDKDTIKLAGTVAAKTAPSFRVVNQIRSSFFDDPNHVTGDKTK